MEKDIHVGHRERMLRRAFNNPDSLAEHELLEVLLYRIVPRVDTNPLAHRLLRAFGDLNGVLSASPSELVTVDGVGKKIATELVILGKIFKNVKEQKEKKVVAWSFHVLKDQIIEQFSKLTKESTTVIMLDKKYNILHELPWLSGSDDNISISTSEIVKGFAIFKPKFLIVVHNHPSGSLDPSYQDDFTTKKLNVLCEIHGVSLIDHIIVAGKEAYSYCTSGRLNKVKEVASLNKIMDKIIE